MSLAAAARCHTRMHGNVKAFCGCIDEDRLLRVWSLTAAWKRMVLEDKPAGVDDYLWPSTPSRGVPQPDVRPARPDPPLRGSVGFAMKSAPGTRPKSMAREVKKATLKGSSDGKGADTSKGTTKGGLLFQQAAAAKGSTPPWLQGPQGDRRKKRMRSMSCHRSASGK